MTSCCPPPQMRWSGATGAIARCKRVSTGCGRKRRSVPAWPWICGVKPTPKAVNKPLPHSIVHGLDKPGVFTTVSENGVFPPLEGVRVQGLSSGEQGHTAMYTHLLDKDHMCFARKVGRFASKVGHLDSKSHKWHIERASRNALQAWT